MRLTCLLAAALLCVACQRLEEEGPSPTSLGDGGTVGDGDTGMATTFMPIPMETDDGSDDDGGGTQACNPVLQTGCAAGEKCTATSDGNTASFLCVGAEGANLQPLDPCEPDTAGGEDACQAGAVCIGNENDGLCVPLCTADGDCGQGVCGEHPDNAIPYCADDCDPFESLCSGLMQCRRDDERFSCQFPREQDNGGPLAACDPNGDAGCSEGLVCISGALVPGCTEGNCCTAVCDTVDGGCTAPATCTSVFNAPAPGFETIGACFVPS